MGGSVHLTKVCNRFPIQDDGVVIIAVGHSIPVLTSRDSSLVDQGDLCHPECFEGVESFNDSWTDCLMPNPHLVLLGIHATPLDYVEANVDNVAVGHREAGASCQHRASEEAEDKCVEAIGGMPVGCYALMVCFAIFRRRLTVVANKLHKHVNKNDVWFAKEPL